MLLVTAVYSYDLSSYEFSKFLFHFCRAVSSHALHRSCVVVGTPHLLWPNKRAICMLLYMAGKNCVCACGCVDVCVCVCVCVCGHCVSKSQ